MTWKTLPIVALLVIATLSALPSATAHVDTSPPGVDDACEQYYSFVDQVQCYAGSNVYWVANNTILHQCDHYIGEDHCRDHGLGQ